MAFDRFLLEGKAFATLADWMTEIPAEKAELVVDAVLSFVRS